MGRIKTALVRRLTKEVTKAHGASFTTDFTKNKEVLNSVSNMPSKKIRNIVAGYTTRIKRAERRE
jgi:small subunit ribosomal protein S17e